MKPITLKMTAFGPYKDTEVIDFRELEGNQLFVISGATGAGKTTIFDGICFALYGQASGEDRADIRALRSHFAHNDTQTEVELLFEIKDKTYRIRRQVPYTKIGNKTETPASCNFFEVTEEGELPMVDRQMVTEINKKVEQLIGFTQAQFSQIVMLPQGEFRKFLTSDTENKELIMRKIFKTDQYRTIVTRLKEQRDKLHTSFQSEKQLQQTIFEQLKEALPMREAELFTTLNETYFNTTQVLTGLKAEQQFYEQKLTEETNHYQQAYERHQQKLSAYHEAKSTNEQLQQLGTKRQVYEQMETDVPGLTKESERLQMAEKAVAIEQIELQLQELVKENQMKEQEAKKASTAVENTTQLLAEAKKNYAKEEQRLPEMEQLKERFYHLQHLEPKVRSLDEERRQQHALREALQIAEKKKQQLKENLQQAESNKTELEQQRQQIEASLSKHEDVQERFYACERKSERVDYAVKLQQAVDHEIARFRQLQAQYETKKQAYEQLSAEWLMSEAATLAHALQEGDACPVCGSHDHPNKAHEVTTKVSKAQLDEEKQAFEQFERTFHMAEAQKEAVQKQLTEAIQAFDDETVTVEQLASLKAQLDEEKVTLQENVQAFKNAQKQLEKLQQQLITVQQQVDAFNNQVQQIERETYEQQTTLTHLEKSIAKTIEEVPEPLTNLQALKLEMDKLTEQRGAFERNWQAVQEQLEQSKQQASRAEMNEIHAKQAVVESTEKVTRTTARFNEALTTSQFTSQEAYEMAKMTEAERHTLKQQIDTFKQRYYAVREEVRQLSQQLEGKAFTALDLLEEELGQLKLTYEQALKRQNEAEHYLKMIQQYNDRLSALEGKIAALETKFGKVEELYNVLRGQNDLKLSFERYIQIDYLEQMLVAANERLREMSNGQFELLRSDRQEGKGRQSGLGLDVYDAYTGQTRDVKTLSGGEKFNAALCLALGMADIIQSFEGAVSIDTMFIDEGFGTLDEESLAKAIDTLIELQKSGRMIGVISHVEELKAALPAILEVKKAKEGYSSTAFILK